MHEALGVLRVVQVEQPDAVLDLAPLAHGHPVDDLAARCGAIREHHDERLIRVKEIGRELGPASVNDIMKKHPHLVGDILKFAKELSDLPADPDHDPKPPSAEARGAPGEGRAGLREARRGEGRSGVTQ